MRPLFLFFVLLSCHSSSALLDTLGLTALANTTVSSLSSMIGVPWLTSLLLGPPTCGAPDTCPNYPCRENPAVVHGYCCGCASLFDLIAVPCPGNIQCPVYREPLCTDYRYMIDCCCRN